MKRKLLSFLFLALLCLNLILIFVPLTQSALSGDSFVAEVSTGISNINSIAEDNEGRLFLGADNDVYRSLDAGTTWTLIKSGAGVETIQPYTIFVDSRNYVYVVLSKGGGLFDIFRSTDNGDTWTAVLEDISSTWHMTEDPSGNLYLNTYTASANDFIYNSTDSGATWNLFYNMSGLGVDHIHWVEASPNTGYVYIATGDGADDSWVQRYNASTGVWDTLSNASTMQMVPIAFDGEYVYFFPDGSYNVWRMAEAGSDISTEGEIVFNIQDAYWTAGNYFYDATVRNDVYVGGTDGGQLWASWDGQHWVKVWDVGSGGQIFSITRQGYPFYFTDRENNKLYRLSLTKEDVIKLYYSSYNSLRGSLTNAENYVLEQRIWSSSTNYLDLSAVGLSNVQASIIGLNRVNEADGNAGFETGDLTDWTQWGGTPEGTVASDDKHNGTYSFKIVKASGETVRRLKNPTSINVERGNLVILSFWGKANASNTNSFYVNFYNTTVTIMKQIYVTVATSWTRYTNYYLIPSNVISMSCTINFEGVDQTTWVDDVLFFVDQTRIVYGSAGPTEESISHMDISAPTYFNVTQNTQDPALTINGQSVSHSGTLTNGTESSATSLTGILTGAIQVDANIQGSEQAILKITGTRILYEDSMILQGRSSSVYYGKYYGSWNPTTAVNDLIAVTNLQANITSFSVSSETLHLNIVSPSQTTSVTYVYCGSRGEPVSVSGTTSWSYNSNTKIATLNVAHSSWQGVTISWATMPYVPPDRYDYTQETWYIRADTWTVNTVLGYKLNPTQSQATTIITQNSSSLATFQVGIRVYTVTKTGDEIEITAGTPVAIASRIAVVGGSDEVGTWTPSATITFQYESAIKIVVYFKIGSGSWTAKMVGISRSLETNSIQASTWTANYYMGIVDFGGGIYGYRIFLGGMYETKIQDISLGLLDVYETMDYKLKEGDFVGFILYPYLNLVGNLFYGLVMLMVCVPLYNRYRSVVPILVLFIIFGGAAGIFTLLVPEIGAGLGWIFMLLGLAGILYKVFR